MEGIYIYTVQWKTVYIHSVFQQIKAQTVLIETLVSWTALEWLHAGQGHRQKVYRLPCRLHWRDEHCFPGVKEKSIDVQKTHVSDTQSWCARTNWGKNRDRAANSCTSKKSAHTQLVLCVVYCPCLRPLSGRLSSLLSCALDLILEDDIHLSCLLCPTYMQLLATEHFICMPASWVMSGYPPRILKLEIHQHLNEIPGEHSCLSAHSINQQLSDTETLLCS